MNKQTAVQWLIDHIKNPDGFPYNTPEELFEQAKEMEKQQIIDAFGVGCHHESKRLIGYQGIAEQYYNENYKSE